MIFSYSKYSTYEKCARKFKYRYVDKLEEPKGESPAMLRGTEIHNSVETYLRGQTEHLHPDIHEYYGQFMFALRNAGAVPEEKVAVNGLWRIVDWDDPTAYVRSVLDVYIPPTPEGLIRVFEWKTGKMYPEHYDQRELYAVKMMARFPEAKMVEVVGVYFDLKKNSSTYIHPEYYQPIKIEVWDSKLRTIERDTKFIPNPSYACRFCYFRKENGGPCEF